MDASRYCDSEGEFRQRWDGQSDTHRVKLALWVVVPGRVGVVAVAGRGLGELVGVDVARYGCVGR